MIEYLSSVIGGRRPQMDGLSVNYHDVGDAERTIPSPVLESHPRTPRLRTEWAWGVLRERGPGVRRIVHEFTRE